MAEDLTKGIGEAISRGAAAMIDASQGTQFYKEIVDREKEERARKFALEQLAEEKKKLDNENARRGLDSLIKATGTKIESLANDPFAINNSGLEILNADINALQSRILNDTNLTDLDREIFTTQLGSYKTGLNSIGDWGNINAVANSQNMIEDYGSLSPKAKLKAQQHPKLNIALAKGEEAFTALKGMDTVLEGNLFDQYTFRLVNHVQGTKANSFSELATIDPGAAAELSKLDMQTTNESRQKSLFMSVQMQDDKLKKEQQLAVRGPLSESTKAEEIKNILNEVYSEDNLIVTPQGVTYRRTPEEALAPIFNQMMTDMKTQDLSTLLDWSTYAQFYDKAFPQLGYTEAIETEIKEKLRTYTPTDLAEIRSNYQLKKLLEVEDISEFLSDPDNTIRNEGLVLENIQSKFNAIWNKEGAMQHIEEVEAELQETLARAVEAVGKDTAGASPLAGELAAMSKQTTMLQNNLRTNLMGFLNLVIQEDSSPQGALESVMGFGEQDKKDIAFGNLVMKGTGDSKTGRKFDDEKNPLTFDNLIKYWEANIPNSATLKALESTPYRKSLIDNTIADVREMFVLTSENLLMDGDVDDDTVSTLIGLFGYDEGIRDSALKSDDGRVLALLTNILF